MAFDAANAKPVYAAKGGFDAANAKPVYPSKQPQEPIEEPERTWGEAYDDFAMGLAMSGAETIQGIGDLVGYDVDPVHRQALEMMRDDYEDASAWAGGGRLTGELAQFALPAAAAVKGGKALTGALKAAGHAPKVAAGLGTGATMAGEVGGAGLLGLAKAPEEGKTRLDRALEEGGSAAFGVGLGELASPLIRGIRQSDAAKRLIREGARLTPAQASGGGLLGRTAEAAEFVAGFTPLLGKGVERARERGVRDWNANVLKNIAPDGFKDKVTSAGQAGATQLKNAFDAAYTKAWSKAGRPSQEGMQKMLNAAAQGGAELMPESQTIIKNSAKKVLDLYGEFTPKRMREVDNMLRKRISSANSAANPQPELASVLKTIRGELREAVSPEARDLLRKVDANYGEYLAVQRAGTTSGAMQSGGEFTPQQLLSGAKGASSRSKAFTGDAALQDVAQEGLDTVGKKLPQPIIDTQKAFASIGDLPLIDPALEAGRRVALGQTLPQRGGRAVADALRRYGLTGGSIAAAEDE